MLKMTTIRLGRVQILELKTVRLGRVQILKLTALG
jgi:hypothetical protein